MNKSQISQTDRHAEYLTEILQEPKTINLKTNFQADEMKTTQILRMESILNEPSSAIVGIGEIGLDFSEKNSTSPMVQEIVFAKQLEMANTRDLPVVIHLRESYWKGIEVLKNVLNPLIPLHVHCFTSDWNMAQDFMSNFRNVSFGFTGLVTYEKAENTRSVLKKIPCEKILLETDAPFFNLSRSRGRSFSLPQDIPIIAERLGELKGKELNTVLTQNSINAKNVYAKFFQNLGLSEN